jgi:deoxyribodipyrimidine photolyase-related protein
MKIFLILPIHLFEFNEYLKSMDKIYIIEDPFYFINNQHKQKLILHRSSMKYYYNKISKIYKNVSYIEYDKINYDFLLNNDVFMFDPIDKPIIKKLEKYKINIIETPAFIETKKELDDYRNKYTNKKNYYHDRSFYKWMRYKLKLLIDSSGKPIGGKWSYDSENRNPFDKNYKEDKITTYSNIYITEAVEYVNKHFKYNFGNTDNFYYPITHEETREHLRKFIKIKLNTFGKYQDAISKKVVFGSHSVLSPMLNIGLITPQIIINEVMNFYDDKNLINIEAFIRQLIGWRSYTRFMYIYHGDEMMKMNKFNHKNKVPKSWYNPTKNDGIINDMILKVQEYAYLHHIERLMIMGNISLLLRIDPNEIYKWFMICFIDSYEWVMVPNVYGMSQYSLTSISMMTRPYISSSNYIKKMSDYKADKNYSAWDALYWYFIYSNIETLDKIYAFKAQTNLIKKMDKKKLNNYITIANKLIK